MRLILGALRIKSALAGPQGCYGHRPGWLSDKDLKLSSNMEILNFLIIFCMYTAKYKHVSRGILGKLNVSYPCMDSIVCAPNFQGWFLTEYLEKSVKCNENLTELCTFSFDKILPISNYYPDGDGQFVLYYLQTYCLSNISIQNHLHFCKNSF